VFEADNSGNRFYKVTYRFKGEGAMWSGASGEGTFEGGKLTTKTQKDKYYCSFYLNWVYFTIKRGDTIWNKYKYGGRV